MIAKYVIVNGKERPPYQMIVYVEKCEDTIFIYDNNKKHVFMTKEMAKDLVDVLTRMLE